MPDTGSLAVYAGSFDPVTYGHIDVMNRAAKLFDRLVVAVGVHPSRTPLFEVDERLELLRAVTADIPNARIDSFQGLLIDYCGRIGARVLIRGLRHSMDFEYELQIAQANTDMSPSIETVFLPTSVQLGFITASLVREIAMHGGDVSRYVPKVVADALARKFGV